MTIIDENYNIFPRAPKRHVFNGITRNKSERFQGTVLPEERMYGDIRWATSFGEGNFVETYIIFPLAMKMEYLRL